MFLINLCNTHQCTKISAGALKNFGTREEHLPPKSKTFLRTNIVIHFKEWDSINYI